MNQFLAAIPLNPLTGFALIVALILAILFLASRQRAQDMKILRDTNEDAIKRIEQLEKQHTDNQTQIKALQEKVEVLERRNKTLEDIVVVALKQYFFEHPDIAATFKGIIQ